MTDVSEVLNASIIRANVKMTVFWNVAPCNLVEIDRRFRGAYCLHHQGVTMGLTFSP
jgi:hypothetical protein